jgi:hypothetical protein
MQGFGDQLTRSYRSHSLAGVYIVSDDVSRRCRGMFTGLVV